MANFYWVANNGTWGGPSGAGTAGSPFKGIAQLAAAINNATVPPGSVITFMGDYGPITLAEVVAQGYGNNKSGITTPLYCQQNPTLGYWDGGLLLGSENGAGSNIAGNTFIFDGSPAGGWHIDCRGANSNNERVMAGFTFCGPNVTVQGLKVATGDWWFTADGRISPNTSLTANYAAEASVENVGIHMWGAIGSKVLDCNVWGADAFGTIGILLDIGLSNETSQPDSFTEVARCNVSGFYNGIVLTSNALIGRQPGSVGQYAFGPRATVELHHNVVHNCRWGDRSAGLAPTLNNVLNHGGGMNMDELSFLLSACLVYSNEIYGPSQDGMQTISVNVAVFNNHIHDINVGYSGTYQRWAPQSGGGSWFVETLTLDSIVSNGIKLGLTNYDGTANGEDWPNVGVAGGQFAVPALRNGVFGNRIHDFNLETHTYGVATNASHGMVISNNEIYNIRYGIICAASYGSPFFDQYVSNNYVKSQFNAMEAAQKNTVHLFNNIFECIVTGTYVDLIIQPTAVVKGSNNRFVNNLIYNGGTNELTGSTIGAADYTIGFGPTPGGNCQNAGVRAGFENARCAGTMLDIDGQPWHPDRMPTGPYRGGF